MSEKHPTVAEQTMSDLLNNGALNPHVVDAGLMEGRYAHNQGVGEGQRTDQVVDNLVERAKFVQLQGGGDLVAITIGMLAGHRQAEHNAGGQV